MDLMPRRRDPGPVIWHKSRTVLRSPRETEHDFFRRIGIIAEAMRQAALTEHAGRHPKIVVHASAPKTEVVINCTVVL